MASSRIISFIIPLFLFAFYVTSTVAEADSDGSLLYPQLRIAPVTEKTPDDLPTTPKVQQIHDLIVTIIRQKIAFVSSLITLVGLLARRILTFLKNAIGSIKK